MAKIIKLTALTDQDDPYEFLNDKPTPEDGGMPIWINADHIIYIDYRAHSLEGVGGVVELSEIYFTVGNSPNSPRNSHDELRALRVEDPSPLYVYETPDEIVALIEGN